MSNAAEVVRCADCGCLTKEQHDFTRISYLKTRKWRCPPCYLKWKSRDPNTRGQRFSCQVSRCRSKWLAPDQVNEVIDPLTEAIYIVCPSCFDRIAPLKDRDELRVQTVKESAYKEGFRNGSMQKPISVNVPMNPDAVRNIAATVAVIAPDFTAEECTSLAQSFFDMVVPAAIASMDPGDAGPKAFDPYAAGRIGAWEGVPLCIDYLSLMEHDGPGLREQYQQAFGDGGHLGKATRAELHALIYGEPGRLKGALRGVSISYLDVDEVQGQP